MTSEGHLAALEPLPKDWKTWVASRLSEVGRWHHQFRRSRVLVWPQQSTHRGFIYADAVSLTRLWVAPRRWALAAVNQRIYFENGEISGRPEHEIVGEFKPPKSKAAVQATMVAELIDSIRTERMHLVPANALALEQHTPPYVQIGATRLEVAGTFNSLYRTYGFDDVPWSWVVSICPLDGSPLNAASALVKKLEDVATKRGATALTAQIVDAGQISDALTRIASGADPIPGRTVLFLLPRKGQDPSTEAFTLMSRLDDHGVPFRRAYADDPLDFSVPDQMPSLLMASGGRPHAVSVQLDGQGVWSVGVDMSHRRDEAASTLVTTLVNPRGELSGAWIGRIDRNEKPDPHRLGVMLRAASEAIAVAGGGESPVLVIRDGRMFAGEAFELYESAFAGPTSVVEYRKGGTPIVLRNGIQAEAPSAHVVPDTNTMLLSAMAPRSDRDLAPTVRLTWRPHWNQAMFTSASFADAMIGLSLAPGLGMHRREKPAPIYWADGIAGVSPSDLRFAGHAPVWLDSREALSEHADRSRY